LKEDAFYLKHILSAIERIELYLENKEKSNFNSDLLLQDGIIRQIEIIGEAAKHVSEGMRKKHPDVPWKDVAGMRDKLIHAYFGVDLAAVWNTVEKDLPPLKKNIGTILNL